MRRLSVLVTLCAVGSALLILRATAAQVAPLRIYSIDVEGGQSTLIVDALGESAAWLIRDGADSITGTQTGL